jgi:hypothetical protein
MKICPVGVELYDGGGWAAGHDEAVMKERPTKCIFKVNHIFRISFSYMFRRCRSAIFREPKLS